MCVANTSQAITNLQPKADHGHRKVCLCSGGIIVVLIFQKLHFLFILKTNTRKRIMQKKQEQRKLHDSAFFSRNVHVTITIYTVLTNF